MITLELIKNCILSDEVSIFYEYTTIFPASWNVLDLFPHRVTRIVIQL